MLLMTLGFLKKDGADVSQNDIANFLSFDVTMTSQVLRGLEKRGLLKAEKSFFVSLGENKPGFYEHLRGILQQQIADAA